MRRIKNWVYRLIWLAFMAAAIVGAFKLGYIMGSEDRDLYKSLLDDCVGILMRPSVVMKHTEVDSL